jgi:hypothetical protein
MKLGIHEVLVEMNEGVKKQVLAAEAGFHDLLYLYPHIYLSLEGKSSVTESTSQVKIKILL